MKAFVLPALREELQLLPGSPLASGEPSWMLHDPTRNQFFEINWAAFEMLNRWSLGNAQAIVDDVNANTTLQLGLEDFEDLLVFLHNQQLLMPATGTAPGMAATHQKLRGSWAQWLLHHYLFIRIPLFKPDRFLSRWAPHLDFFYSKSFFRLTLAAALLGLAGVYREWDRFSSTLVDMISWQGLLAYALTLVGVKVLHELGHGFTAKRHGCRVPTMGIAFLVLWPVAYTDTNEVWKLTQRRQKLEVAAAGIATELTIAAWATLAWMWLPDGLPRSMAFLLSTTTWISTLLINASPFMRFDGYFLLSDYLEMPNLHKRSFDLARWDLRERLFDLGEQPPEHFSAARAKGLILFAWVVWIYRLVVFLGIAALVYQFFIKAVGIFLFAVEIAWFILMPLKQEWQAWKTRWPQIRTRPRTKRSAVVASALILLFIVPWPTRVSTSGMLQPSEQMLLYAPVRALVGALPHEHAHRVEANKPALLLDSPELQMRREQAEARKGKLHQQTASAGFDNETRKDWEVLQLQLQAVQAEQTTVQADTTRYMPSAPFSATLHLVDPDFRPGQWLSHRETIARMVGQAPWQVVTYVDEENIARVSVGDRAFFVADGLAGPNLRLRVRDIDKTIGPTLHEAELASVYGGHVPVREKNGILHHERSFYRVVLQVESDEILRQHSWRGHVSIAADWEIPGVRFLRAALTTLRREMGF